MKKKIIIIGGRTQSRSLAESLLLKNHYVTIVSDEVGFCERLSTIKGLHVFRGDGRLARVLEDADIFKYDIAITMYEHDADNLVTCELCKKVYGVKKTVSLLSDVKRKPLFDAMGVDSVICATSMIAGSLEQQPFSDQLNRIVPTTDARIRISEITVAEGAKISGMKLKDIPLPNQAIIGCLIRNEEVIVPYGATKIVAGDSLLLITDAEHEDEATKVIAG